MKKKKNKKWLDAANRVRLKLTLSSSDVPGKARACCQAMRYAGCNTVDEQEFAYYFKPERGLLWYWADPFLTNEDQLARQIALNLMYEMGL